VDVRTLATGLAINRCLFGVGYLVAPAATGKGWFGPDARRAGTGVAARALGARDLALGLGALQALRSGEDREARTWFAAHALSDGMDLLATLAARRDIPAGAAAFGTFMAAASTAVAVAGATRLEPASD
jgi:hypothetical protein